MRKLNVRKYRFLHCKNHVKSKTYLFCQNYVSEPPYRSHTCHRQHICADRFIAFSRDPLQKSEKKLNLFPFPARNLTSRAHEAWQRRRPEERKKSPIRPGTDTIWCLTWPNGSAKKKEIPQNDANKQIFKQQIIWRERPNRTLGHRDRPAKRWQHLVVERKNETQWRMASVWELEYWVEGLNRVCPSIQPVWLKTGDGKAVCAIAFICMRSPNGGASTGPEGRIVTAVPGTMAKCNLNLHQTQWSRVLNGVVGERGVRLVLVDLHRRWRCNKSAMDSGPVRLLFGGRPKHTSPNKWMICSQFRKRNKF